MFSSAGPLSTDSAGGVQWTPSAVKNAVCKSRWLLWVDAVGGFFVCQGAEVRLGQATPDSDVELPLLADLSRHHATIRRDDEGYTIEPLRDVWVDGRRIETATWLNDGCTIRLGGALVMRFSRPHPLSATARLDFLSHHRTQPSATAVLLMADTCVLGPAATSHVVCRHWPHEVVLHRQHGGLFCRSATPLEIDGVRYQQPRAADGQIAGRRRPIFVQLGGNLILDRPGGVS